MNSWLDTLAPAARVCNPAWRDGGDEAYHFPKPWEWPEACYGRTLFHWSDVIHDHAPIRIYAPPETFCFTLLREPGRRLVSQFADWRQLSEKDLLPYDDVMRACILDTRNLTLTEFLARHGNESAGPPMDNYLTRALAASLRGEQALSTSNVASLLDDALHALHKDYDFIGLAEAFDVSRNALCALLGLPPCGPASLLNASRMEEDAAGALILNEEDRWRFTRYDQIIYDAARRLFETRFRALGENYSAECFERRHAEKLLSQLRATYCAGAVQYCVSDPFYGTGLHQRDGGAMGPHGVWTISGRRAAIYVPVPAGMPVSLLLWIRGYAGETQRDMLRVWVDGRERVPGFEPTEGYREVMVIPHLPSDGFARLEMEVPDYETDCPEDTRQRGISFDAYGWRPRHPDSVAAAAAARERPIAAAMVQEELVAVGA